MWAKLELDTLGRYRTEGYTRGCEHGVFVQLSLPSALSVLYYGTRRLPLLASLGQAHVQYPCADMPDCIQATFSAVNAAFVLLTQ